MLGQRAQQTFHRLVRHQTDAYEPRVLQPGSEEMNPLAGAVAELHFYLPKIVLSELSGKTFEADQRLHRLDAERGHQRVQGGLASLVARFANPAKDLQRGQIGCFFQNLYNGLPEILHDAGSADPPLLSLRSVIDMKDW